IDWQQNTVFAVVDQWFHQHFNTGKEPGRLMSFSEERSVKYQGITKIEPRAISVKRGGTQIEFEDEDPEIRRSFKEELAKTGVAWQMSKFFPGE
ncbi:MAG: ethanolamine ammonia lyase-activating protein, partial [Pseudomonadota bacterium]